MHKNQITAILTLKDRSCYTERWLHSNYSQKINYIIADGSQSKKNQLFFYKNKKENIVYIKHCPDKKPHDFILKIYKSIKLVKTKYFFLCDNDDFINLKNIDFIHSEISFTKSELFGFQLKSLSERFCSKSNRFFFSPWYSTGNQKQFDALSAKQKLLACFKSYNLFWYNIFSRKSGLRLWKIILNLKIQNVYALEIAQSLLSISLLKYKYLPVTHYARINNSKQSFAKSLNKKASVFDSAILNSRFQNDFGKLKKYIISHKICTVNEFDSGFKSFLLKQVRITGILRGKISHIRAKALSLLCFKTTVF